MTRRDRGPTPGSMDSLPPADLQVSRRGFLGTMAGAVGWAAFGSLEARSPMTFSQEPEPLTGMSSPSAPLAHRGFDPWIEIDRAAFQHNVRETSRLAGGRPILAVVKNNAYGLGDTTVGPLLAACPEVAGLACVRVAEALALRRAGVRKPILNMAEVSEQETAELVRHRITSSLWLDDAPQRMARVAKKLGRPVPVELFMDAGMGREGMPDHRARPWLEALCGSKAVQVRGTYMTFAHQREFGPEQIRRFLELVDASRKAGLKLGRLHTAPTYEVFLLPESHLDMVRPGNALFGNYPSVEGSGAWPTSSRCSGCGRGSRASNS